MCRYRLGVARRRAHAYPAAMGTEDVAKAKEVREAAQKLLALDYFAALAVARAASPEDVKKAFLVAVTAWHPDRVPKGLEELKPLFAKVFARLELARATLSDPPRRLRYIEDLAKPTTAASAENVTSAEATLELRKAEAMLKKNDAVQAERHLRRAIGLAPAMVEAQVLLVWLQAKPDSTPDRIRQLVTDLDRLLERDAKNEKAYFFRGSLKKRLEQIDGAAADFTRAATLNPQNVDAAREVRIYKMRQEKAPGAAKKDKERAPDSSPEPAEGVGGFFRKLFKR
jgi:curved DNA-binding protein CbpA